MTKTVDRVLLGLTFVAMWFSVYMVFLYAPIDKVMGVTQKIFYYHLPLAWYSFFSFFLVFLASIMYLYQRHHRWDRLAVCAAELGVIFCTLVLITGSIWARPMWNVWWTWDPRLTTVLILWCLYIAYLMLRKLLLPGPQNSNIAAVFGIVSFINVPISFLAIRMWRTIHPVVIDTRGVHISTPMLYTLLACFAAFTFLFIVVLRLRLRIEHSLATYQELQVQLEG